MALRVLILGTRGFVGNHLAAFVANQGHEVTGVSGRSDLDLCDAAAVKDFFARHERFDWVVHCSVRGGSRLAADDASVFYDNVRMFENVLACSASFGSIIYFSSGAAVHLKNTPYGLSKHVNDALIRQHPNGYLFRIYGCFGIGEPAQRIVSSCLDRQSRGEMPEVHQDKLFDNVYIDDLCQLVARTLAQPSAVPRELDVVYREKYLLSQIARLCGGEPVIRTEGLASAYAGSIGCIDEHVPHLIGLAGGIDRMREQLSRC